MSKGCFFMGHHNAPASIASALQDAVEEAVTQQGITEFIVGQYGSFDRMSARAVIEAKKKYHGISLTMLLPYYRSNQSMSLPAGFDGTLYPERMEKVPKRAAIVAANRYMIEHSDLFIVYVHHIASNSYEILRYAEKKGVNMIRL